MGASSSYDTASDEIDLATLITALRREWKVVAGVFVVVVALVVAFTFTREPVFEAASDVLVETSSGSRWAGGGGIEELLSVQVGNRSLQNEIAILERSVPLAERVAARMLEEGHAGPLVQHDAEAPPRTVEQLGRTVLYRRMRFAPVSRDTDLITITASSTDPGEAALLANLYAEEYTNRSQEASRARVVSSRAFLDEQVDQQRARLEAVEADLQSFITSEGAIALDSEAQRTVQQAASLDVQLEEARVELEIERTALAEVEAELQRIQPGLQTRVASGVEAEMQALQSRLAELELEASQYYSVNPALRGNEQANDELAAITQQISGLRTRLSVLADQYIAEVQAVGGIDGERTTGLPYHTQLQRDVVQRQIRLQGLEARQDVLRQQLSAYEQRMRDIPRQSIQLVQLQRQQQAVSQTYLFLVEKLQEARVAEQSQFGAVQLIRRADVPVSPVRPRTQLNLMVGVLLGLMMGVGVALLRRSLDRRIRTADDLRGHDLPVLTTVPDLSSLVRESFDGKEFVEVGSHRVASTVAAGMHPLSPMTEAMRRLRTGVQFSSPDHPVGVLLVSSTGPKEGKTTAAINLAISMASAGKKTLLIDGDLRRPMIENRLGLLNSRGLSELLFMPGEPDWEGFRCRIRAQWVGFDETVENLYVIPAGKNVSRPAELLGSRRMREVIEYARDQFDIVVIDSPPLMAVTDALVLADLADAGVLVARAGQTDLRALRQVHDDVVGTRTPVLGVILNGTSGTAGGYGYTYGYSGYGGGYLLGGRLALSGDGAATSPHDVRPASNL